jgi:hypothetical protein
MTEDREDHLLTALATIGTLDEAKGFRAQLVAQGEQIGSRLYAAMMKRTDFLAAKEGRAK